MSGDVLENLSRRMLSLVRFFGNKEMNIKEKERNNDETNSRSASKKVKEKEE